MIDAVDGQQEQGPVDQLAALGKHVALGGFSSFARAAMLIAAANGAPEAMLWLARDLDRAVTPMRDAATRALLAKAEQALTLDLERQGCAFMWPALLKEIQDHLAGPDA